MPLYGSKRGPGYPGSKSFKKGKSKNLKKVTSYAKPQKALMSVERSVKTIRRSTNVKHRVFSKTDSVTSLGGGTVGPFPYVLQLTNIGIGSGENGRDGNMTTVTGFRVKGLLIMDYSSFVPSDAWNLVRILIVKVKHPKVVGTAPTFNVPLSAPTLSSTVFEVSALYNLDGGSAGLYKILYDRTFKLSDYAAGSPDGGTTEYYWDPGRLAIPINIKINRKFNVEYDSGTSTACIGNDVWLVAYSTSSATPHPILTINTQTTFKDL